MLDRGITFYDRQLIKILCWTGEQHFMMDSGTKFYDKQLNNILCWTGSKTEENNSFFHSREAIFNNGSK